MSKEHKQISDSPASSGRSSNGTKVAPPASGIPFADQNIVQKKEEQKEDQHESKLDSGRAHSFVPPPGDIDPPKFNPPVQRKAANGLPSAVNDRMESVIGADFSGVKFHPNSTKAHQLKAQAYTQGRDVHFAPGKFNPNTKSGQELIGHELTHVKQQSQGRVQPTTQAKGLPVNDDKGLEAEADRMGSLAANAAAPAQMKLDLPNISNPAVQFNKTGYAQLEDDPKPKTKKKKPRKKNKRSRGGYQQIPEPDQTGQEDGVEEENGDSSSGPELTLGNDDNNLSISQEKVTINVGDHQLNFNMAEQEGSYTYSKSLKIPSEGVDSEWVTLGLDYPILPGLNAHGSLGVGGGVELGLSGTVGVKRRETIPNYSGKVNLTANGNAGIFGFVKLGVNLGVPNVITAGGGVKAKIGATTSAELTVDAKDIIKQNGRWTTADGIKVNLNFGKGEIKGSVGLYMEAKFLGMFSATKEITLAEKKFGEFAGKNFSWTFGDQEPDASNTFIKENLQDKFTVKDGELEASDEGKAMVVTFAKSLFKLKEMKSYLKKADSYQKAIDERQKRIDKGKSTTKKIQDKIESRRTKKNQVLTGLEDKLRTANEDEQLLKRGNRNNDYFQLSDAPEIINELDGLNLGLADFVLGLEGALGASGKKMLSKITPENAEKIVQVMNQNDALTIEVKKATGNKDSTSDE